MAVDFFRKHARFVAELSGESARRVMEHDQKCHGCETEIRVEIGEQLIRGPVVTLDYYVGSCEDGHLTRRGGYGNDKYLKFCETCGKPIVRITPHYGPYPPEE